MLTNRRTFIVKKPWLQEALELLVEYRQLVQLTDSKAVMRVYASEIGPFDSIACELGVASLTAFEQALDQFQGHPTVTARFPEWSKRKQEITEPGGTNEFWRLIE